RWSQRIAAAWVLTRNKHFVSACAQPCTTIDCGVPSLARVQDEASDWRYDMNGRGPVMLFPSAALAARHLRGELSHDRWDFSKDEVLARFPELEDIEHERVVASVWRGADPHDVEFVSLSHAAWWLASDRGNRAIVLDDVRVWQPAFKEVISLPVSATEPPQYCEIAAKEFLGVPFIYPCGAWHHRMVPDPAHVEGALIVCDLERGDCYYSDGGMKYRGLMVRSSDLIALRPPVAEEIAPVPALEGKLSPLVAEDNDAVAAVLSDDVDDEEATHSPEARVKNKHEP